MKDDKKEVMGTEEPFEEQELIHTQDFESPEVLYQRLINKVKEYHPSDDISMIEKAYNIANNAHKGQLRKSGEPYIIHPLCVALILADLELDKETIVGGLLHDVVEDTIHDGGGYHERIQRGDRTDRIRCNKAGTVILFQG